MSYKLDRVKRVMRLLDGAVLPCTFDAGTITALDEHSPFVREFRAWHAAGNVPLPADPEPLPDPRILADEAELAAAKQDAALSDLINMDPTRIAAAIDNAFPDPAQRAILKRICRVLIPTARKVFR